jgi:opacity protein-like surface antigen
MKKGYHLPHPVSSCRFYEIIPLKQELKRISFFVAVLILTASSLCAASEIFPWTREFDRTTKEKEAGPDKWKSALIDQSNQFGLALVFQDSHEEDEGIGLLIRYRQFINQTWSLNLAAGNIIGFNKEGVDIELYPIEATLLLHQDLDGRTHAYAGGGIGYYYVDFDATDLEARYNYVALSDPPLGASGNVHKIDIDNDLGFIFILGVEQQVGKSAAFFCEIRYLALELNASADTARLARGLFFPSMPGEKLRMGGVGLTFGIMWKF